MSVDVSVEIEIGRPRAEVAAFAADPDHVTAWYSNIVSVEWLTDRPLAPGSRVAFIARFLGRRIAYTYEIEQLVAGDRLVMSTKQGPFPMTTTYVWRDSPRGTAMTLRNSGLPAGFSRVLAPFISAAVRRATTKDLARLKKLLESR